MAIEYNFNGKGKYDEERRATTYSLDSPTKNTVDNYDSVGYNENKKSTPTITPSTDFEGQWKEKNQGLLKYAGDSAKKSVDKGLKEAPSYMKDADEGTSFENVQTASVKRNLAQDSNNDKLHQSALMEMIGHLSKDNKEDYLKHSQPLQKYIDVKDEFDFKNNNYTTTENVDITPDENVRQLQRELNESGYTDKFGQPLKEDGIYGGKTAYANDSKKANSVNSTNQRFGNRANLPSRGQTGNSITTYFTTANVSIPTKPAYQPVTNILQDNIESLKNIPVNNVEKNFDYNTRLSYNQNYSYNVQILQEKLSDLGYLDMSSGDWGYFGLKTLEAVNKYKNDKDLGNTGKDEGVVGKDTWESLGLVYRTQEDIDAGVKIVTIEGKEYKDVSIPINKALNRDKHIFTENANDLDWFKEQVGDNGSWNIKRYDNGVSTWEQTIGSSFPGHESTMILYGHKVTVEDIGNITYGYLGKAARLADATLYAGSAYNDFRNHRLSNIDGERRDWYWISVGIEWYKNTKK